MQEDQNLPKTPVVVEPANENTGQAPSQSLGNPFFKRLPHKISLLILVTLALSIGALIFTKSTTPPVNLTVNKQESAASSLTLTLESPVDETIVVSDMVTVKGKTLPNTTVVFYTDTDANSVESDATGYFEGTINLSSGINTLNVQAFAENGEEKTITLDIVYDS